MRCFHFSARVALAGLVAFSASDATAQITEFDLEVVASPALDGREFGGIGAYERLRGIVRGAVDPEDRRNRDIVNIDRASRNADGLVEYRATVEIYRPVNMSKWNGAIFHTVSNRGGAGAAEPALLARGFAFVRIGWQGDLEPTESNIVAYLPIATNGERPVTAPALEEFIFNDAESTSRGRLTYPAAMPEPSGGMLSVRAHQTAPRSAPSDLYWRYVTNREIEIDRPNGYDSGAIYEFIYEAREPIVLGLGFAAMRDAIAFLRYDRQDASGNANPLEKDGLTRTAISLGISQSGRMLRDFVYQGFNEDTQGRIVFDGVHPNIAGSRKTFTNYQFGQPGRWQKQHEDHVYPGDQFPFTYTTLTDSLSGRTDGLLARCADTGTCPKVIHSDGEAELWQARASLVVTDPAGKHIELPDSVRVFLLSGTQHGGGPGVHTGTPRAGICQHPNNPLDLGQIRTALSVALHEWVADGTPPPASRFPTVANGGLVAARGLEFPTIPGSTYNGSVNPLHLNDHRSIPPMRGAAYPVLVGRIDNDGNMTNGVRHPNLAAPVGPHTGWNLRRDGYAPNQQCGGTGSFFPFEPTASERASSGDPRLSFEERYADHETYVTAVQRAAAPLVAKRLLLAEHVEVIVERAATSRISSQN